MGGYIGSKHKKTAGHPAGRRPSGNRSSEGHLRAERPAHSRSSAQSRQGSSERQPQRGSKPNAASAKSRRTGTAQKRSGGYRSHKRLTSLMMYAAVFVTVVGIVIVMSLTVFFKITTITVNIGQGVPYSQEDILACSPVTKGQNLLLAPVDEAEQSIIEKLPYIERCTVSRSLPAGIVIDTVAAVPAGYITSADGQCITVSTYGKALAYPAQEELPWLTQLNGLSAQTAVIGQRVEFDQPENLETVAQISQVLSRYGLSASSITFSGGTVTFCYDNRINCKLGAPSDLENKVILAATLLSNGSITIHESGDLDLTISGKAIFTPEYVKQAYGLQDDADSTVSDSDAGN